MFSRRSLLALLALPLPLLLFACGKKGDPRPPIRLIPRAATDLSIAQRGDSLVLSCAYPNVATNGMALPNLQAVEIWRLTLPAAAIAEGAPPLRPAELAVRGEQRHDLRGAELSSAISGDRLVISLPLPELSSSSSSSGTITATEPDADGDSDASTAEETATAYGYGLRFVSAQQEESDFSNLATIVPQPPPVAPFDLQLEAQTDGVAVSWQGAGSAGSRVYRRTAQQPLYGDAIATREAGEQSYLDRGARYGQRYVYSITALAATQPLIESKIGEEREIDYQDRFAPPTPGGLLALAESDRIRLSWQGSPAADLAGYYLYRRMGGGSFERLNAEATTNAAYVDTAPGGGERTYKVTAVDQRGNESTASQPITTRLADR